MNYEVDVIQKAFERRLKRDGLSYTREAQMELVGRADFIVYSKEGPAYIVECKCDCSRIRKAIAQLLLYASQLSGRYVLAVIVPTGTATDEARRLCERWNVKLGQIDVPSRSDYEWDLLLSGNGHKTLQEM